MQQTGRQTDTGHHFIMPPPYGGWDIITIHSHSPVIN